jgi:hypothetical protein
VRHSSRSAPTKARSMSPRDRPLDFGHLPVVFAVLVSAYRQRVGVHIRTSSRWCWWLRNAALSDEQDR